MTDRPVLAFDTSGAWCAAALITGDVIETRCETMTRGQAERLMPLLEDLLVSAGLSWAQLSRIGVGIGPGNFTGLRISVSAARGLALGLEVPAIGVSGFDALRGGTEGRAAVPGPRDTAYLADGTKPPQIVPARDVPPDALWPADPEALVAAIARLAARRGPGTDRPAPLYIRPADAAPSKETGPVILDA